MFSLLVSNEHKQKWQVVPHYIGLGVMVLSIHSEAKVQNMFNVQQSTVISCNSMYPAACEGVLLLMYGKIALISALFVHTLCVPVLLTCA